MRSSAPSAAWFCRKSVASLAPLAILALVACGSAPTPPAAAAPSTTTTRSATAAAPARNAPAGNVLRRSALRQVTTAGLGAFLQHVSLDDHPVFVSGKFHGFRLASLDAAFWNGVDLKPGDVVTGVNGFPIEHPEDALEAFKSLEVASEIRVDLERDGAPREMRYTIDEDEGAAMPDKPTGNPARPAPAPPKAGVHVIR